MAKYVVTDNHLISIADAIRNKADISENLAFPSGFISAIDEILEEDGGERQDRFMNKTISSYRNKRISSISPYAFYDTDALRTVSFPEVTIIGSHAFHSCTSLRTVSFPKVITIGESAFTYCRFMSSISFPEAIYIKKGAFQSCSNIANNILFPQVISIESYAFASCTSLTTVSFPEATYIGDCVFQSCSNLSIVSFPKATIIASNAFLYCRAIQTISFPEVIDIGSAAWRGCTNLTTAFFPKVATIASSAFYACSRLISLYLLGSSIVTLMASNIFNSTPIVGYVAYTNGIQGSIFVPESLLTQYQSATNWKLLSSRIVGLTSSQIEEVIS